MSSWFLLCSAQARTRVGNVFTTPTGGRHTRPPTPGPAKNPRGCVEPHQELPATGVSSRTCVSATSGACFCFHSPPVQGQLPRVTHSNWLLADFWPLFLSLTFISFSKFPLVFPDTHWMESFLDLFKVRGTIVLQWAQGQERFVFSSYWRRWTTPPTPTPQVISSPAWQ